LEEPPDSICCGDVLGYKKIQRGIFRPPGIKRAPDSSYLPFHTKRLTKVTKTTKAVCRATHTRRTIIKILLILTATDSRAGLRCLRILR